jgi:hypothetical protein
VIRTRTLLGLAAVVVVVGIPLNAWDDAALRSDPIYADPIEAAPITAPATATVTAERGTVAQVTPTGIARNGSC